MSKVQHPVGLTFAILIAIAVMLLVWGNPFAPPEPLFELDVPAEGVTTTSLRLGLVKGRTQVHDLLEVGIEQGDSTTTFLADPRRVSPFASSLTVVPGLTHQDVPSPTSIPWPKLPPDTEYVWVALRMAEDARPPPVVWPDETPPPASPEATREAINRNLFAHSHLVPLSRDVSLTLTPSCRVLLAVVKRPKGYVRADGGSLADIVRRLTDEVGDGDVRFLIEVRLPLDDRSGRWPDTAEVFEAYKNAEVRHYLDARAAGRPYEPSRPDRLVLPRGDTPALVPEHFAVLELPPPAERLDRRMILDPDRPRPQVERHDDASSEPGHLSTSSGDPLTLDVAPAWQARLWTFTTRNVHRRLAVVLDGRILTTQVIPGALREHIVLSFQDLPNLREVTATMDCLCSVFARQVPGRVFPTTPVAAVSWRRAGGPFDVLVPLTPDATTRISLRADHEARMGAAAGPRPTLERLFVPHPSGNLDLARVMETLVTAVDLGFATEEEALEALAPFDDAIEALGRAAAIGGRPARAAAASRILGYADPDAPSTWRALATAIKTSEQRPRLAAITALGRLGGTSPPARRRAQQALRPLWEDEEGDPLVQSLAASIARRLDRR